MKYLILLFISFGAMADTASAIYDYGYNAGNGSVSFQVADSVSCVAAADKILSKIGTTTLGYTMSSVVVQCHDTMGNEYLSKWCRGNVTFSGKVEGVTCEQF